MTIARIKECALLYLTKEEAEEFGRFLFGEDYKTTKFTPQEFINQWNSKYGDALSLSSNGRPIDDIPKMIEIWKESRNQVHVCGNKDFQIHGSQMKIWDSEWADWDIYEINYCPLCGKYVNTTDK